MESKQNSANKRNLIFLFILLVLTLIVYLPGMNRLGYYRDDWNNVFNAYTQGSQMLIEHYASDRPADGYLLQFAYNLFGPNPYPYLMVNLLCRFLISLFFFLTLVKIWRRQQFPAFVAAAFFLVFPGFLRQVDGIAYVPHQVAMLCALLSIYLSILCLSASRIGIKLLLALFSIAFALGEMFLMEYYIGLEAFRFLLIFCYFYNRSGRSFWRILSKAIVAYLPWLVGALFFFIWRSFLFTATRRGADVQGVIQPLFDHPKYYIFDMGGRILRNTFRLLFGSWAVPLSSLISGMEMRAFWNNLLAALPAALIFLVTFLLTMPDRKKAFTPTNAAETRPSKMNWRGQWVLLGAAASLLVITPMILANREINFYSSLDRFAYPGIYPAVMFLVGVLASLEGKWLKTSLITLLFLTAAFSQIGNKENYIRQTAATNQFWWQLTWRAPQIKEGTLVLLNMDGFSAEEDYELFAPLHLIYYPDRDHVTVGSDLLNNSSARKAEMKVVDDRMTRKIFLWKDYGQILAVTKPTEKSCVQVINGRSPIYSPSEWSRIREIGQYSQMDKILTAETGIQPPTVMFGNEPARGWCYYYEKMSLAQQQEDWQAVAAIADEALANGAHGEDAVEWLPLVQAYAYTGRFDEARPYGEILKTDDYLKFQTCAYFRNAEKFIKNPAPDANAHALLEAEFCN